MSIKEDDNGQVKIKIPLLGSALDSGFESESVWAEPLGGNQYRIWNLPVFAYNIDMGAIVECVPGSNDCMPVAVRIVEAGNCYVVRLYFSENATDAEIQAVLSLLEDRHAIFEKYDNRLWTVGLRTIEDYEWLGPTLKSFVESGVLDFESGYQPDEPFLGSA